MSSNECLLELQYDLRRMIELVKVSFVIVDRVVSLVLIKLEKVHLVIGQSECEWKVR